MEDDRVAILESQLSQAKQIAEEADKKYEEVYKKHPTTHTFQTKLTQHLFTRTV